MTLKPTNFLNKIRRNEHGVAVIEFALIAPMFFLLLMGVFDFGYAKYIQAVMQGAMEDVGRDSSLESTSTTDLDARVRGAVKALNSSADSIQITRYYYEGYSDVKKPEDFTDSNGNGIRDAEPFNDADGDGKHDATETFTDLNGNGIFDAECFIDRNGNAKFDTDVGESGRGGAQDVVVYKATFTYTRIFPLWKMLNQPSTQVITAQTQLRNQPFSAQRPRNGIKICS